MITLSSNAKPKLHRPWRRRISNQLAAFAAIMLFASTQVGTPENSPDLATNNSQTAARDVLPELNSPSLELTASLDQAPGKQKKSARSSKKSSLKLNLFRFRR